MSKNKFSQLPLSKEMLENISHLGFKKMTPVQEDALPHILKNKDVIAQAKTGSGKTVAFGIGVLNKIKVEKTKTQALVLCPTRELAEQVARELRKLARFKSNIKILILCGGSPIKRQYDSLKHGAHIVVGTPGRVLKHLQQRKLWLDGMETFVLDEAHRMLDMGFIDDIKKVIKHTPRERQTLLFSATYPEEILELSESVQHKAVNIQTISTEAPNKITEYFYKVFPKDKFPLLMKSFSAYKPENVIIFCNTKQETNDVARFLQKEGIKALAMNGDLEQYQRTDVLVQFVNKSCSVMVATDVAARGIDIKELSMVINFQPPHDDATYTHRIGRTGRAGKEGIAITFYSNKEEYKIKSYQNDTRIFDEGKSLRGDNDFLLVAPNATLVIEGGKKHKVRPGDILGALTKEAKIDGSNIGKIDIYDTQSYVAIKKDVIKTAFQSLKNGKIKGKSFPVWIK